MRVSKLFTMCTMLAALLLSHISMANDLLHFDRQALETNKQKIKDGTAPKRVVETYEKLLRSADKLLEVQPPSVIDKKLVPPTNDKRDYLSISRYWWPNPDTEDGLPWIRKDGETNPSTQNDDVDRDRLGLMEKMLHSLSLAYFFTEDEKYAKKTAEVIDRWFLDKKTGMKPHLEFSQSVPGNPKGRRSGMLDGRVIPMRLIDAVTIISPSEHWSKKQTKAVDKWLKKYLKWMTSSELGKKGAKQRNNHGSWYFYQVATMSAHLGDEKQFKDAVKRVKMLFDHQFDMDGSQPLELDRTRGFFYSCFNLTAIFHTAKLADKKGMPFWDYVDHNGKNLYSAVDYLLPAILEGKWEHRTKGINPGRILPVLYIMHKYTGEQRYKDTLDFILKNYKEGAYKEPSRFEKRMRSELGKIALFYGDDLLGA